MNRASHITRRILAASLAALAVAALAALLPAAVGARAGSAKARAHPPSYDSGTLELAGTGVYRNPAPHAALRVSVCLRHKVGGRFFDVRCVPASTGKAPRVTAVATVPGCVKGRWRTRVTGETQYRRGGPWSEALAAVSRPIRC